jgi:hypothetical protein
MRGTTGREHRIGVVRRQRGLIGRAFRPAPTPNAGATDIPRKPNYDFERRERERTKAADAAKKAQAKADKRAAEQAAPATDPSDDA